MARNLPAAHSQRVSDFLARVQAARGRLIFALDATASPRPAFATDHNDQISHRARIRGKRHRCCARDRGGDRWARREPHFYWSYGWSRWQDGTRWCRAFKIEIKPVVGDDYPAVLRQMKRNGSKVLFVGEYRGRGVTQEQFVRTMATAGIRVVFAADVAVGAKPALAQQPAPA